MVPRPDPKKTASRPAQQRPTVPAGAGQKKSGSGLILKLVAFIVLVVIAYLIISWAVGLLSVVNVSAPTTVTLTNSITLFSMNGNEYAAKLVSTSNSTGSAEISLTRLPILLNPNLDVFLYINNSTSINTVGQNADMEIKLIQITQGSIKTVLVPIPESFNQAPTPGRIFPTYSTLQEQNSQGYQGTNLTANSISSSTTTSTTVLTSTTVTQAESGQQEATAVLESDVYYPVMLNYSKIYVNTRECSPDLYNKTYDARWGALPNSTDTYENVSALVPYALNYTITNSSASIYKVTYTAYSRSQSLTGGPALVININVTSKILVNTTLEGVFGGLNYSQLQNGYLKTQRVPLNNDCGIYVCSSSRGC